MLACREMTLRTARVTFWFAVLSLLSVPAQAQSPPQTFAPQDQTFSPQLFHPAVGPDEFLSVEPAAPLPHLNFNLGLWFNYSRGSFALSNITCDAAGSNCKVSSSGGGVVRNLLGADLVFSIGLF